MSIDATELKALSGELSILDHWLLYSGKASPMYRMLARQALERLRRRAEEVAALSGAEQWRERQQRVRRAMLDAVGPFPVRTPLNAHIVSTAGKGGYHIERVVFESQPGFYVTGIVFVPDGIKGRAPAILNPIGHTDVGFRTYDYQQLILNLVQKGFIVFPYDPAGQGERLQYFDPEIGASRVGSSTVEHSYVGDQCSVAGSSMARYVTWDGMRAIDYLQSRDDVDPARIGVTGISGGGTRTAYISAMDERVAASSPCCYITGFRRLLESIGPQDAEQNLPGGIAAGIDHADYLEVRAPKPTLIVSTTRDFFSIQGAREMYAEAKAAYEALGAADSLQMAEDDLGHGYTRRTREATYGFFQRFLDLPGDAAESDVEYLTPEELRITETGQVLTSLGGETVFSLNRREAEATKRAAADPVAEARRLSGYVEPGLISPIFAGRHNLTGYAVEQYMLPGEGDYHIPVTLLIPEGADGGRNVVYLHPGGRAAALAQEGPLALVRAGCLVAVPDIIGVGELGGPAGKPTYLEEYTAALVGRSVLGMQAGDIVRVARWLRERGAGEVAALAEDALCPALLHAAAFEPGITRVALLRPLVSYASAVTSRYYSADFAAMVPRALTAYDLPDLMASLTPRPLLLADVVDQHGNALPLAEAEARLAVARRAYGRGALTLRHRQGWETWDELVEGWLA